MKKNHIKIIFFFLLSNFAWANSLSSDIYIRASQVGFLKNDLKSGIVFSENDPKISTFEIRRSGTRQIVFSGKLTKSLSEYSKFHYCYYADFTPLKETGTFYIQTAGIKSAPFEIGPQIFNKVVDSLMLFFKAQRCGPTNPILHEPCHLSDITSLRNYNFNKNIDVTGGWHDAADYVKFFTTTAYTTYLLLFSYEFDNKKFGFDNDRNNVPDILEEAKIGLDWMLRSNFYNEKFIVQVQDLRDHEVGLRLPENDSLRFDRPGFVGTSKSIIGMYSAVLALASKIWKDKFYDYEFSNKCLKSAEKVYKNRNSVPNVDNNGTGHYQDIAYWGKLSLGAIELFNATQNKNYLIDAEVYADSANSDYWWSWGNINSIAHYKVSKINKRFATYIYNNLYSFNHTKSSSLFNEGIGFSWGTTLSMLGVSLQAILYKKLTGSSEFDSLAVFQRDYILGRNPWGLSFIYNIGTIYPKNLHSQIAYFHNGYLPGALSAGPAPLQSFTGTKIIRTNNKFAEFNTDSIKYFDDFNDFITNEPTITGNSTAVFVYGYYSQR